MITVDNNYPSIGDYSTLQAAHDAASDGDTIYVFPSNYPYSCITVTKELTFIGAGFDLSQETLKTSKLIGTMNFQTSSSGSVFEGFDSSLGELNITVDANSLLIKRNKIQKIIVTPNRIGIAIIQNYFLGYFEDGFLIQIQSGAIGITIANNKIINGLTTGCQLHRGGISIADSVNCDITNNVIWTSHSCGSFCASYAFLLDPNATEYFIANNIIFGGCLQGNGNQFFNNMNNNGYLISGNGNLNYIDMNTVFVDFANWDFHLKPGSPAIGSGQGGVDMGIYGGNTPYNDNGYPGVPAIYYLDVPYNGSQQDGVNVTIKVKSVQP
jgi:hypothetical protein